MSDQDFRTQEFRDLGFRCLSPTPVIFLDGTHATVKAESYKKSGERSDDTPRQRRVLRLYTKSDGSGQIELIDELELEEKLGVDAFNQLLV